MDPPKEDVSGDGQKVPGDKRGSQETVRSHVPAMTPTLDTGLAESPDLPQETEKPHETKINPGGQSETTEQGPSPFEEDTLLTPRIRDWSSTHTSGSLSPSTGAKEAEAHQGPPTALSIESGPTEYFPPTASSESNATEMPKEPSVPAEVARPATSHDPDRPRTSSLMPLEEVDTTSKDANAEEVSSPVLSPGNTRPTSVPNFQSASLSRRRDTPEYPQYPNQSFAALQKHPAHPHPLRTRTSNPLHELSYTSSNASSSNNLPHVPLGSRTVGNTPAQSPSLFSPTHGKKSTTESEDGGYSTPLLHPTHLQAPKETHTLIKNTNPNTGRKHINQYELREKLGSGQHGTVKLAVNLDNSEKVAVKIVRRVSKKVRLGRAGDPNEMIKKEVAILKKARHPHVVSLYEVVDDEEFAKVYLVLEFVERGEIVWRKATEKNIAVFEKARLEREKAGNFDKAYEDALVEEFNSQVPQRREEKARLYEEQLREAKLQLETQRHRRSRSAANFWSLELGPESEYESIADSSPPRSHGGSETRLSRADFHAAETGHHPPSQEQSPTPMHTPRSHPYPATIDQLSSSQPNSRPESPSILDGSMYGAFSEDGQISDLDLQATLQEIMANQTQWSESEEEFRYVPCLTLDQALRAFRDTVLGVEYLHFQGIMHRDIKPANLLWTADYRVKISDFGVSYLGKPLREDITEDEMTEDSSDSKINEELELAKTVGTPAFYAPELCDPDFYDRSKTAHRPAITNRIDVWALGVTLYGMIFGRLPFFDPGEFKMYEKIAREDVFIPRMRLRGVEHTDKAQPNYDEKPDGKRFDDALEYEEVDDTLRDLIKRLLIKDPAHRISLMEVKVHPWVVKGIEDRDAWLASSDPQVQRVKKIEPSTEEVQYALGALTLVDRVKMGVQRIGSVFRGRGSRKRTDSNPKPLDSPGGASSKAKEERRSSLAGNEAIFASLKASRDPSDHHPLSQSVAASPEASEKGQYFDEDAPRSAGDSIDRETRRPSRSGLVDYSLSTADSMKTIRAPTHSPRDSISAPATSVRDAFPSATPFADPNQPHSTTLGSILNAPGRFMNTMRSRERGQGRSPPSQSSRASSVEPSTREDFHASPSLAMSNAIAPGRVDQPAILRDDGAPSQPRSSNASSTEALGQATATSPRRQAVTQSASPVHRRSVSHATGTASPPSPDDMLFFGGQQRPASAAESTSGFQANAAVSSSSDMIFSGDSAAHSRIPSVVSGASSLSMPIPTEEQEAHDPRAKSVSPFKMAELSDSSIAVSNTTTTGIVSGNVDPSLAQAQKAEEEAAGYNGEPEEESDSDDEGLAMAPNPRP